MKPGIVMKYLLGTVAALCLLSSLASAEGLRVITRENAIRGDCRFFSPIKARVKYDDLLEILGKDGDWLKVKFKDVKGCIHKSAVTEKEVSLNKVSGSRGSASGDEVALAGKGFNPQVEESFKGKHPDLDFKAVDAIESYTVTEDGLQRFLRSGELDLQ